MRLLPTLLLVFAVACETTPPVPPTALPGASAVRAPASRDVWTYSGTLLRPADPSLYENVLDAAIPLRDGGWLVLKQTTPRRAVPLPRTVFGGGLFRAPIATLLRLDAHGVEVAREHGSEAFGLRELRVFEDLGLVIGYGAQILGGSIHAFDLATLDGRWTEYDRDPVACVQVADRCWTYRRSTVPTDTSALTERDPRTYRALRTFFHLGMDGLETPPGIYPGINTVVWNEPGRAGTPRGRVRVERLDLDRPPAAWASRVETACWVHTLGATHLYLRFGDCAAETGGTFELFEVVTGRTVRMWPEREAPLIDGRRGYLFGEDGLVDLRDGSRGPDLPGDILAFDDVHGVAAVRLWNGGAAVYRRGTSSSRRGSVDVREIARLACTGFEFAQVAPPRDRDGRCPEVATHAGPRRLLITRGRVPAAEELPITGITADAVTRELTIQVDPRGDTSRVPAVGVARVIEVPDALQGQWLVRLDSGGSRRAIQTFVIDLP